MFLLNEGLKGVEINYQINYTAEKGENVEAGDIGTHNFSNKPTTPAVSFTYDVMKLDALSLNEVYRNEWSFLNFGATVENKEILI